MCCSTLNHSGRLKIKNSILSTCQVTKYVHYNKKMRITYITGFGLAALNFKLNNQTFLNNTLYCIIVTEVRLQKVREQDFQRICANICGLIKTKMESSYSSKWCIKT